MLNNLLTAKLASVVAVAVLATGTTAAAAATGDLPGPAQDFFSSTASLVGVDLPDADGEATSTTSTTTSTTETTVSPSTTLPPAVGVSVKPGAETCEAARAVEGAKGCSEVAHQAAPGQSKAKSERPKSSNPSTKPMEPVVKPSAPKPAPKPPVAKPSKPAPVEPFDELPPGKDVGDDREDSNYR